MATPKYPKSNDKGAWSCGTTESPATSTVQAILANQPTLLLSQGSSRCFRLADDISRGTIVSA